MISGSWISEDGVKKVLRLVDGMAYMTKEGKRAFKDRLTAASRECSEPPQELAHSSRSVFEPETVLAVGFLVAVLFFSGLTIQWTAWRMEAEARGGRTSGAGFRRGRETSGTQA